MLIGAVLLLVAEVKEAVKVEMKNCPPVSSCCLFSAAAATPRPEMSSRR